jgi:hypothetical protein
MPFHRVAAALRASSTDPIERCVLEYRVETKNHSLAKPWHVLYYPQHPPSARPSIFHQLVQGLRSLAASTVLVQPSSRSSGHTLEGWRDSSARRTTRVIEMSKSRGLRSALKGVSLAHDRKGAQCYWPDGTPALPDVPCTAGSGDTFCCWSGHTCLSNKLCLDPAILPGNPGRYKRGTCTDSTWESSECPSFCTSGRMCTSLLLVIWELQSRSR